MFINYVDDQIVSYLIYKNNMDFIAGKIGSVYIFLMGAINKLIVDFLQAGDA